ncbi:alginate O-acetyltransferase AlgX-related protein [Halarcobacter sp.]|uniref:alginate O-acetyltransferase AlgX-related protein n=1 Tax=Halarcobacter sp. TaxID=2321133 RepID=UPI002AAB91DD|nr:hypothetical protein [Halarcobacter sp.]
MIVYKQFVNYFLVLLVLMLIFHVFIWNSYTKYVVQTNKMIYKGDLTRKTYKIDSVYPRYSFSNPKNSNLKKHIPLKDWDGKQVDIITIGDSFSNGDMQGLNPFYQDYIVTINNKKVLNIPRLITQKYNYIEIIQMLNNSGMLKKLNPKYVIIESIERFSIERFSTNIDFSITDNNNRVFNFLKNFKYQFFNSNDNEKAINFININNFKAFRNNMEFNFISKYGLYSSVYIEPLSENFFTSEDKNSLLFFKQDIDNIILTTKSSVEKLNENFNKLAKSLSKNGIKLYFMPVVDKYNLYSKYIKRDVSYPTSSFFELLRPLKKDYVLIDTKKILRNALKNGEKDIFYSDDTHWSYKASEMIFKKVKFD